MAAPSFNIETTHTGQHGANKISMRIGITKQTEIIERVVLPGGREISALIDTGAEVSIVSSLLVESEGWEREESSVKEIEGIVPGSVQKIDGEIYKNIRLKQSGLEGKLHAYIVNEVPRSFPNLLVGLETLSDNKWSVIYTRAGYRVTTTTLIEENGQYSPNGMEETKVELEQAEKGEENEPRDGYERRTSIGVIKVQEDENDPEVVYDLPAGEDLDPEDEDHMPPMPQANENEVKKGIDQSLRDQGRPLGRGERFWEKLRETLHEYWRPLSNKVGGVKGYQHEIDTGEAVPIAKRPYRTSNDDWEWLEGQVEEWLAQGLIEKSNSAWCTPHVIVKKKGGDRRAAFDFRGINKVTKDDRYPMPRVDEILDEMSKSRIFTSMDMMWGYWQIPMKPEDKEKTAFRTRNGLYHWKVMPFGVKNGPATFQRVMNEVLKDIPGVRPYIDDVMVHTPDEKSHLVTLASVLSRLQQAGMVCKLKKCNFAQPESEFLGFVVGHGKVRMQSQLVTKISNLPEPVDKRQVRRFVGMCSFYRHFIRDFSSIAAPLTSVMGKTAEWKWGDEQREAYADLKLAIIADPVLCLPDFDKPFIIYTDASNIGTGAVLTQQNEQGKSYVVRYLSKKLNDTETRYSTTEREYLAVIHAVRAFKVYIVGRETEILTDHQALVHMIKKQDDGHSARVKRWAMELQGYDLVIKYVKGKHNEVADALSREPFIETPELEQSMNEQDENALVRLVKVKKENVQRSDMEKEDNITEEDVMEWILREVQDEYWEEMAIKQRRCPELLPWIKQIEAGKEVRKDGGVLLLDERVLFKVETDGRKRLVVPQAERESILRAVHEDSMNGGHFSAKRGMLKVRKRWWWPGVYRALEQWVATCRKCAAHQHQRGFRKIKDIRPRRRPMGPWIEVHIDMIGPLPLARGGYMYILVAIDAMTEYMIASPIRRATAGDFLHWLHSQLIAKYGPMVRLLSDRGSNFMADISAAMYEMWGIDKVTTTAWRPQSNGLVERANGTLKSMLKVYAEDVGKSWPTKLPDWVYAYNTTVHSATGFTPFHLFHGWESKMPYDLLLKDKGESGFRNLEEYRNNMVQVVEEHWAEARQH